MPKVDVIGSHPDELFTLLQAAGYTYTQNKMYSDSTLKVDQPPVAVIVHGGDVALESNEAVLKLLKMDTILLLFTPSQALLRVVKSVIKTSIDLPLLELPNDIPLIVHKIKGLDHFHLIPGFSQPLSQDNDLVDMDNSPRPGVPSLLEHSIKLIGEFLSYASDPEVHRALVEDTLRPPIATDFVSSTIITVTAPDSRSWWDVHLYTYATNVNPNDEQFKEKGGLVYTIIRHDGTTIYPTLANPKNFRSGDQSLLRNAFHQPKSYSQVDGTTLTYDINFTQTFNLFTDGGRTAFEHRATYTDNYSLNWVIQSHEEPDPHTYVIKLAAWLTDFPDRTMNIHGLSMWYSDLGTTTMDLVGPMGSQEVPLDLTFKNS